MKARVLIVEDQFIEAHSLERMLLKAGYDVISIAASVEEALFLIENNGIDLVLLDIFLKGKRNGLDLAEILGRRGIAFVYLSANSNQKVLERAKQTRPYGFLVKPFREKDVLVMLDIALHLHSLREDPTYRFPARKTSADKMRSIGTNTILVGSSTPMLELFSQIEVASGSNISVLISGESGTGKELVANEIHKRSSRSARPMVTMNCSAIPVSLIESEMFGHEKGSFTGAIEKRIGKFEQANGGTIFLDEIGELPLEVQAKFLRVLQQREIEPLGGQSKKVDVRIIAATNRNLEEQVASGRFRLDLYYRIGALPIYTPPLRQHKSDIPLLANHFITEHSAEGKEPITAISPEVLLKLQAYDWPGNVRELENVIVRSMLYTKGGTINEIAGLTVKRPENTGREKTIAQNERDHIISVLDQCGWKVSGKGGAADILSINVSTLNSRMKKLGISRPNLLIRDSDFPREG